MSVTDKELAALREKAAKARNKDREDRAKNEAAIAERTREIKADRLKRELGLGLDTRDSEAPAPSQPEPTTTKSNAVTPPRSDSDNKSA